MLGRIGVFALALALVLTGCGRDKPAKVRASDAIQKGLAAHVAGRLDEATKQYEKALDAEPNNAYALYNLGLIAQTKGNMVEAERKYRDAIAIDPRMTSALFNLAIIRTSSGALTEAIELYRRVIAITPRDPNAHLNLGFALKDSGQTAAGEGELKIAVQLDPKLASRIPKPARSPQAASPAPTPS